MCTFEPFAFTVLALVATLIFLALKLGLFILLIFMIANQSIIIDFVISILLSALASPLAYVFIQNQAYRLVSFM